MVLLEVTVSPGATVSLAVMVLQVVMGQYWETKYLEVDCSPYRMLIRTKA